MTYQGGLYTESLGTREVFFLAAKDGLRTYYKYRLTYTLTAPKVCKPVTDPNTVKFSLPKEFVS